MSQTGQTASAALDALCARVSDLDIRVHCETTGESVREWLHRFLVARDYDVDKAEVMVRADVAWRCSDFLADAQTLAAGGVAGLALIPTEVVVGCPSALLDRYFDSWAQGVDREGRPVCYKKYGTLEVSSLIAGGATVASLVRYHVAEQERLSLALKASRASGGARACAATFVIDAKHWHVGLATSDAMKFLRSIADVDQAHYPERLGKLVVVNAPMMLSGVYSVISGWIAPATRAKIRVLSWESAWRPALLDLIAPDQLCDAYGGTAPRPPSSHARAPLPVALVAVPAGSAVDSDTAAMAPDGSKVAKH
jgi:hypothetical protein